MKPKYLGNNSRGKWWWWAADGRRNVQFLYLLLAFIVFLPGVAGCWLGGLGGFFA